MAWSRLSTGRKSLPSSWLRLYTRSNWIVRSLAFGPLEEARSNSSAKGLLGTERRETVFVAQPPSA